MIEDNLIIGGENGISIEAGSPELTGNTVEGASGRGIAIAGAAPVLRDNTVCGNGTDLWVDQWATPGIDDSNEICEGAAAD